MLIINIPYNEYFYEFEVVKFVENNENGEAVYAFKKNFENGFLADKYASEIGGIVIHHVRIQGKKRRTKLG